MKRKYIILLLLCGIRLASQAQTVQVGDTIFLAEEWLWFTKLEEPYTIVNDSSATHFGIVKSIADSTTNLQIFRYPNEENGLKMPTIVGTRKVMTDSLARKQFVFIGRQVDFYPTLPPRIKMGRVYNTQHLLVDATMQDLNGHVFRKGFFQDGVYVEQQFYDNDTLRLTRRFCSTPELQAFSKSEERYDRNGKPATEEQVRGDLWAFDEGVRSPYTMRPSFKSGTQDLSNYLSRHLKYPEGCFEKGIEGRSLVQFTIDTTGLVTDVSIKQSSGDMYLDQEAIRVVSKMPKWNPGYRDGKKVRVRHMLPINFRLEGARSNEISVSSQNNVKSLSLADLQNGDTLWLEKVIANNSAEIPYTTLNQRDPYPSLKYTFCEQKDASHYAILNRQDNQFTLSICKVGSNQVIKSEPYQLSSNGTAYLDGTVEYYRNGLTAYREFYQNGKRKTGEWLNLQGQVYKRAMYKEKKLKFIQSFDPATNKIWKQKMFLPNPYSYAGADSVTIRYFSDNGDELNADALSYQPPYTDSDFSEDRLSRWLSRNYTIKPYLSSVGMFKWTGSVLVDEVGAIAAFVNGSTDIDLTPKRKDDPNGILLQEDILDKLNEYVHLHPAQKGGKSDIGEFNLSFFYSPLYYAENGDTLFCASCEEVTNVDGKRIKVSLSNTQKQYAPYYALVKREDKKLDLDFYRVADNALLKRAHYICVAPDSILPDGIVEFHLSDRWIPVKKFDNGLEYENWFLNNLAVGDVLPVRRIVSGTTLQYRNDELIGILPTTYTLVPGQSTLMLKVLSKTKDTVEITYQDTISHGRVQKTVYVREKDMHYRLAQQLISKGDSVSVLTEALTDSTQIRTIYNENQIIQSRYYLQLKPKNTLSDWLKQLYRFGFEDAYILWAEKYDSIGNVKYRKSYRLNAKEEKNKNEERNEVLTSVEVFYPTGETKIRYNLVNGQTLYFDSTGQTINSQPDNSDKVKKTLKKYIQSFNPKLISNRLNAYIWEELYVIFRVSATGDIEYLCSQSTNKIVHYGGFSWQGDAEIVKERFSEHLCNVSNANLKLEPCTMDGKPIDNIVVIYIKKMQKNIL